MEARSPAFVSPLALPQGSPGRRPAAAGCDHAVRPARGWRRARLLHAADGGSAPGPQDPPEDAKEGEQQPKEEGAPAPSGSDLREGVEQLARVFDKLLAEREKGQTGGKDVLGKAITEVLEIAYRKAWVALSTTGTGEAYAAAIKEFVLACVTAYKSGYSIAALNLELYMNQKITGDEKLDSVLTLSDGEKKARQTWIELVYLTLNHRGFAREQAPPKPDDHMGLENLVRVITDAHKRGYTLDTFKLEESLRTADTGPPSPELERLNKAQKSIRSQFMRIVFIANEIAANANAK